MDNNQNLIIDFHQFIAENESNRSEELVNDYYKAHKNSKNEKELLKLCLYEKALIARDNKDFEKSNKYYSAILSNDSEIKNSEKYLIKLFICQNLINLTNKEEVLSIVNEYFQSESKDYDFDFLVCYARLNEGEKIERPYVSIINAELLRLGYQNSFPKTYAELIKVFNIYKKESKELTKILCSKKEKNKAQLIEVFKAKSNFALLVNQAN